MKHPYFNHYHVQKQPLSHQNDDREKVPNSKIMIIQAGFKKAVHS